MLYCISRKNAGRRRFHRPYSQRHFFAFPSVSIGFHLVSIGVYEWTNVCHNCYAYSIQRHIIHKQIIGRISAFFLMRIMETEIMPKSVSRIIFGKCMQSNRFSGKPPTLTCSEPFFSPTKGSTKLKMDNYKLSKMGSRGVFFSKSFAVWFFLGGISFGVYSIKKHKRGSIRIVYAMTPDVSWIQEEETLLSLNTIPNKTPLLSIQCSFLFVNADMAIETVFHRVQTLDVSGNLSRLPKETVIQLIQSAKEEFAAGHTDNAHYSLDDILIWNAGVEPHHLLQYSESDDPTAISSEFTRGSIFYDLIFPSSVFIFHSNQHIFMIFRESNKHERRGHHSTKRVHFSTRKPETRKVYRN